MQNAKCKGMRVEDLVPAERTADQAIDFGCASTVCWSDSACKASELDAARLSTRRGRIVMTRLEHRDVEEVGAVSPYIEMRERVDRLCRLAIDRSIRADGIHSGIRTRENVGIGHPVVDQEEERHVGGHPCSLDRQICGAGEASRCKRGK